MVDVARPLRIGLQPEPLGLRVGVGDDQVLALAEVRRRDVRGVAARVVAVLLPDLAVAVEVRLAVGELAEERGVIAVAGGELDGFLVRAREPERRIRLLPGLEMQLGFPVAVVLALEIERIALAGGKERLQRLAVLVARLLDALEAVDLRLDRRHAAPDAELEAPARELVEHAHFVIEAVRVVPGQAEGERAEAQPLGALDHRREQHGWRAVDRERRALVLGEHVGVEPGLVGGCRELQLVCEGLGGRARVGGLDPIKEADTQLFLHDQTFRAAATTRSSLRFWSSSLMRLPTTSEPKPHCGLMARRSSGTYCAASSIR